MKSALLSICFTFFIITLSPFGVFAQIYPVTLDTRIQESATVLTGTITEKIPYWDDRGDNIYTLHLIEVEAYLKGYEQGVHEVGLITEGGVIDDKMEITFPGVKLSEGEQVLVFLTSEEKSNDYRAFRSLKPEVRQSCPAFGVQGILKFQNHKYVDRIAEAPMTEVQLLDKLERWTHQKARRPNGAVYEARPFEEQTGSTKITLSLNNGAGTSPSSYVAGTILTDNELIISGTGFGASTGTVIFSDADAGGGGEFIVPLNSIPSDIISWSDTEIRLKIPTEAGNGTVEVKNVAGTSIGSAAIAVDYGINNVSSNFYDWPSDHRNRLEMVDMDGQGGYTFEYNNNTPAANTSFWANVPARAAFERALESWRCNTGVNFDFDDSGTAGGHASDNGNIIIFQNLNGGTLGVTTTRYSALANGACSMENTLWYLEEIDIRFNNNLSGSFTWNYGPGNANNNQYDFESTAVHELGHAHGLGHIVSPGKVMHYALSNGAEIRDLSPEDITAGAFKVAHSVQSNCITSPAPMVAVNGGDCAILPIELLEFIAYPEKVGIQLNWTTSREVNNDYFTVERSADGKFFVALDQIDAMGFTASPATYRFLDETPFSGTNYYRLKQTDFNGAFTYSDIRVVDFNKPEMSVSIFPNPVTGQTLDVLSSVIPEEGSAIQITDLSGKQLVVPFEEIAGGFRVRIENFAPGIYFISIISEKGRVQVEKFIKQ